jgi:undecaprenyl phosphate-alpha-L-ara4N flippase subunit ArnE
MENPMSVYLLITLALCFTTGGQILQKIAAGRADATGAVFVLRLLRRPETWWAAACLFVGALAWLGVLYRMEVSKATPFLSFGFILVTLVSRYYLKEPVSRGRWAGVLLITLGLWMVALS